MNHEHEFIWVGENTGPNDVKWCTNCGAIAEIDRNGNIVEITYPSDSKYIKIEKVKNLYE